MALVAARRSLGARARRQVTALTVDHRLRPEAAAEAAQVAQWLGRRGIAHVTLAGAEPLPRGDVQAAARAARYRLLEDWCARCRRASSAHRASSRRPGRDAAAAPGARQRPRRACRHVGGGRARAVAACCGRCCGAARAGLRATLEAGGQDWIEDPSNRNSAYRPRAAARQRGAPRRGRADGASGSRPPPAGLAGHGRRSRPRWRQLLARAVTARSRGLRLARAGGAQAAPEEIGLRGAGGACSRRSAAQRYPPRLERLERLYRSAAGRARRRADARRLPHLAAARRRAGLSRAERPRPRRWRPRLARPRSGTDASV